MVLCLGRVEAQQGEWVHVRLRSRVVGDAAAQ